MFALAGGAGLAGTFTDPRVRAILPQAPGCAVRAVVLRDDHRADADRGGLDRRDHAVRVAAAAPYDALPSGARVVALAQSSPTRATSRSRTSARCSATCSRFLGGFDEACEPRHLPWRHAHDIINYLALNFFDAVLRDDADALARLDPAVIAGIEDLRYWRK